jgi:hypothetical protein
MDRDLNTSLPLDVQVWNLMHRIGAARSDPQTAPMHPQTHSL